MHFLTGLRTIPINYPEVPYSQYLLFLYHHMRLCLLEKTDLNILITVHSFDHKVLTVSYVLVVLFPFKIARRMS